ncbi:MAG: hypothetical protein ABSA22_12855 [Acidimicrobiales bacterium]
MTIPYSEPLNVRTLAAPVIPEPPRRGEPGGEPCGICSGFAASAVWSNDNWSLHPPVGGSLAGAVWLASRDHVDSFSDLSDAAAAEFVHVVAKVERSARDARSEGNDASPVGGRTPERHRRRVACRGRDRGASHG